MIEDPKSQYLFPCRLLRLLAVVMAAAILLQALGCLAAYLLMLDAQAAGMMAHLLMQQLSHYLLGCTFVILSLANILIKRGISQLKTIRLPSLILMVSIALVSFLLIPRMDYLRDTALEAGMPVMLSPFANYFVTLNSIAFLLLCAQIASGTLIAWRMSSTQST